MMFAEVVEKIPGVKAAVVSVGKDEAQGIVADRLDALDFDIPLAGLQNLLAGAVAAC